MFCKSSIILLVWKAKKKKKGKHKSTISTLCRPYGGDLLAPLPASNLDEEVKEEGKEEEEEEDDDNDHYDNDDTILAP